MSFFLIIWVSSLAFGLQTIIGKLTAKYSLSNPWQLNFFWTTFNLLLVLPIATIFGVAKIPINFVPYIIAGVFLAIGNIFLTYSIYKLDITVISPLFALRTAFTAILGALFLQEHFSLFEYLLITLIFISGMLIRLDEGFSLKKLSFNDLKYGIACMFFLALSGVTIKIASTNGTYWNNMLWINAFTTLFLTTTIPLFIKEILKTPLNKYLGAFGYSLSGGIGRILMFYGMAINATITTVVISIPTSMLVTIPLSYIFPQLLERHTTKIYIYRLLLAVVMITCSIKLSLR